MQTAKSILPDNTAATLQRVTNRATIHAARQAKRLSTLNQLTPDLETLAREAKEGGLGLIGYFLDMAIYEAKRETDLLSDKIKSA